MKKSGQKCLSFPKNNCVFDFPENFKNCNFSKINFGWMKPWLKGRQLHSSLILIIISKSDLTGKMSTLCQTFFLWQPNEHIKSKYRLQGLKKHVKNPVCKSLILILKQRIVMFWKDFCIAIFYNY